MNFYDGTLVCGMMIYMLVLIIMLFDTRVTAGNMLIAAAIGSSLLVILFTLLSSFEVILTSACFS